MDFPDESCVNSFLCSLPQIFSELKLEDVLLVEFMHFVFTRMPDERVTAGILGLCCCVHVSSFQC